MKAQKIIWALSGKGINIALQAGILYLTIKTLTKYEYGQLATALSISLLLMHFVSPGITNLQVQEVAGRSRNRRNFGKSFFTIPFYGFIILLVITLISYFLYKDFTFSLILILCFFSESILNRSLDLFYSDFQGKSEFKNITIWQTFYSGVKLLFIFIVFLLKGDVIAIGIAYILSSAVTLVIIVYSQKTCIQLANFPFFKRKFRRGIYFALGISAKNAYSNVDKLMISKMAGFRYAGEYTLAQRITSLSFLPVQAYLSVSYPEFFKAGANNGLKGSLQLLKKIYLIPLLFSLLASVGIFLSAPLFPFIFGSEYATIISVVKILSLLPIFQTISYLLADCITGAGFQKERTKIQGLAVVINIILNILLIPTYLIKGAIVATYFSELSMVGLYLIFIYTTLNRESNRICA